MENDYRELTAKYLEASEKAKHGDEDAKLKAIELHNQLKSIDASIEKWSDGGYGNYNVNTLTHGRK
jgi:hypothetical protein